MQSYSHQMHYALALSVFWLALGAGSMGKSPATNTREDMIAGMTAVLHSWDKDADGKLSRAEVAVMIDEFFRRVAKETSGARMTADLQKQRQEFLGFYASQDTDRDGYLTLDELLKGPLATFDCMDENRDGKVSQEEMFSGLERCPSTNLEDYAPNP
jgi:Ca2+-binding EF-hand superfamily protein